VSILPSLSFGLANQWILLLLYAGALILSVMRLSKDKRQWLFEDSKVPLRGTRKLLLRLGQLLAIVIIALIGLTPLFGVPAWLSALGLAIYVAGTAMVVVAIYYFGRAPDGLPVIQGPYGFSRNPQWVGLFLVFLGLAVSGGSGLLLLVVFVLGAIYHIQILEEERACCAKYGQLYEEYVEKVPRYLLIK
jgi:protein-S-isoprenylcysteine O-methyltransferase Ste14